MGVEVTIQSEPVEVIMQGGDPVEASVDGENITVDVLSEEISVSVADAEIIDVVISQEGPQGPRGPQGLPGEDAFYLHDQMIASATWTVVHNLNKYPSVTIVTSAGDEVEADVQYLDINTVQINFSAANSGKAYLN